MGVAPGASGSGMRWTMIEGLEYKTVEGEGKGHEIVLFTLSTCGFCKKAMAFLDRQGLSYRYIHVDHIPLETKTAVKKELKELYHEDVAFPFAVIDRSKTLVGFIEPDWKLTLGIEG
jgi:glutaredoxin